jgi:hypothetical protein
MKTRPYTIRGRDFEFRNSLTPPPFQSTKPGLNGPRLFFRRVGKHGQKQKRYPLRKVPPAHPHSNN